MYTLYWGTRTSAFIVDAVLTETGARCARHAVRREPETGRVDDPDFARISPMHQIPALGMPDGTVLTESVAIVLTLAERHPDAGLLPAVATAARARTYRWLMHIVCNVYECDLRDTYADRYTDDPDGVAGVKAAARRRWDWGFQVIEDGLGEGPWFLGADFGVLDLYLAATVCWHYDTPALLDRSPKIAAVCANVRRRPKLLPLFERYGMNDLDRWA